MADPNGCPCQTCKDSRLIARLADALSDRGRALDEAMDALRKPCACQSAPAHQANCDQWKAVNRLKHIERTP